MDGGEVMTDELRKAQAEAWDKAIKAAARCAEENLSSDCEEGFAAIRALPNPYRSETDD